MRIQRKTNKVLTLNLNGNTYMLDNKIELAAMTLYMSRLGLKCSRCSYEKYSVEQTFNDGRGTVAYQARCLKCGRKRSVEVIFNKEAVPDV